MRTSLSHAERKREDKVESVMLLVRKIFNVFMTTLIIVLFIVLIFEIKREYKIDLIEGVNFTADDWYFDTFRN